ncbi:MAG: phage head morphogenesis protein [Ruminococcus sp.]|nr:phage head morphogenesis protein [Ruminococcus sp.]
MSNYLPQKRFDEAYIETEDILANARAEIESIYGQAESELKQKALDYLKWFTVADNAKLALVKSGKLSNDDYQTWRRTRFMTGKHHYAMLDVISANLENANQIAANIINGYTPQVYATNLSFTTYSIENTLHINTNFTLYNEQAVERLIRDKPDLLPKAKVNIAKDKLWNKQQINSAVAQSIIQGENIDAMASRISRIADMNKSYKLTNAATMFTSAQNGGRNDAIKRANQLGIECNRCWVAVHDGHTRKSHRQIDGEVALMGHNFSNGLEYAGDPHGDPAEVYGCRCATVPDFNNVDFSELVIFSPVQEMSYSDWKNAHGGEPLFKAARNETRDLKMHAEYRKLLGNKVPKYFSDFQKLKYKNTPEWKKMVSAARKERNKRRMKNEI